MPVIRIRKTEVEALPFSDKPVLWFDTDLKGFGVRVTKTTKAYFAEARVQGRTRRFKVGNHGPLTADEARRQAKIRLGQMASGVDPSEQVRAARARSMTLSEAFADFLRDRVELKETTRKDMAKALRTLKWDRKQITTITGDSVLKKHRELSANSEARANLTMRYLRAVLNYANDAYTGDDEVPLFVKNPVKALTSRKAWNKIDRRKTLISESDLKPWTRAVLSLHNEAVRDYLLFVPLTGLRREEGLRLSWDHVDLKARTFTIPDTKNREDHTLPLSNYLLDMLKARDKCRVHETVFGSARGPLSNLRIAMDKVQSESGVSFCIHDLRRTFATIADRLDLPAYAIKRLMNHKDKSDVTGGYIVTDVERLRKPMQMITDYVLSAAKINRGTKVVPIRSSSAA